MSLQPNDVDFEEWWNRISSQVTREQQKGLNIIILGAWTLWRHHNDCIFNGRHPSLSTALIMAANEKCMWEMAGVKGLCALTGHATPTTE
ncbi:hypothetical protein PR202_ga24652 [Eleusine coracana subsp. coracana]|uniref:Uncharacterized protein n=1 Tax=Eleusine coracana subsp. coracana TaxID=191504 RepID=A0AAV5D9W7_ELECO|nr:hypothetical protein PR202_ga24652 [Eleusine coracana subsp. coracana]